MLLTYFSPTIYVYYYKSTFAHANLQDVEDDHGSDTTTEIGYTDESDVDSDAEAIEIEGSGINGAAFGEAASDEKDGEDDCDASGQDEHYDEEALKQF